MKFNHFLSIVLSHSYRVKEFYQQPSVPKMMTHYLFYRNYILPEVYSIGYKFIFNAK